MIFSWCIILVAGNLHPVFGGPGMTSCIHDGVRYNHGEYFISSKTVLRPDYPGQCIQCRCEKGMVVCEMESCLILPCDSPVETTEHCCPQCPGSADRNEKASDSIFSETEPEKPKRKEGCISDGKFYKEDSRWQPVMGPLGVMSCVECRCQQGEVTCTRFPCKDQPCSHPRKQFGDCCPVCPTPGSPRPGEVFCLPKSSEVLVYKTPNVGNQSERIEYAFFKTGQQHKYSVAELHTWDTRQHGTDVLHVAVVSGIEVPGLDLGLLGATSFRNMNRFARREKKLQKKCKERCSGRVLRLEATLRLFHIQLRTRCNIDEMDARSQ